MSSASEEYPAPTPHGKIENIGEDMFMVRGTVQMRPLVRISRNMAVVRHEGDLTLVNPIRLSATGEEELRAMGRIRNIIRLGAMHGLDDRYYVERCGARLWSQAGGTRYEVPPIDVELQSDTPLPFPGAQLFFFDGIRQPECVLLLQRDINLLLTCDAIQHYGDYRYNNVVARLMMPFMGFPRTTVIGPFWFDRLTEDKAQLKRSFERILALDFDALLSAHGSFLKNNARERVRAAVAKAFAD